MAPQSPISVSPALADELFGRTRRYGLVQIGGGGIPLGGQAQCPSRYLLPVDQDVKLSVTAPAP